MNEEKYLPLGSVVILKGASHNISIIGFCLSIKEKNNRQYDYVGVPYPEGYLSKETLICFDHEDIEKVISIGYSNEDEKKFKNKLIEVVKEISKDGDTHYVDEKKFNDKLISEAAKYGKK